MNRYQLHKVQELLRLIPRHDVIILTETKETKTTRKQTIPGYVDFDLLAFTFPRADGLTAAISGGIKIMCKEDIAKYMTVWHRDPDHNYVGMLLMSADGGEATFIGGMYFPPEQADAYDFKTVTKLDMLRPITADIQRMHEENRQVNILIFADLNVHIAECQIELPASDWDLKRRLGDISRRSMDKSKITKRDRNTLQVCQENHLVIMNGLQRFPGTEQCTYTSKNEKEPDKRVRTLLDHGLCHVNTLDKVRIFRLHNIGPLSDHKCCNVHPDI